MSVTYKYTISFYIIISKEISFFNILCTRTDILYLFLYHTPKNWTVNCRNTQNKQLY